ncbi:hypothetical protein ACVINH_006878 [Rhizobium anhuiense]|jgi:hypothetical protein
MQRLLIRSAHCYVSQTAKMENANASYDVITLCRRYAVSRHEAARLLKRFGSSRSELDLLLSGRGRTRRHRRKDLATPEDKAAFGIG